MLLETLATRVFLLSTGRPTPHLHSIVLQRRGGRAGSEFSKLLEIYMQKESATAYIEPKRTARKGVKAGNKPRTKSTPSLRVVEKGQQQNDTRRDDAMLRLHWQKFCKTEVPVLVMTQMWTIKELELELGEELTFGGPRGSLKGRPGAVEDHRHRAFYETLSDSEEKLQNFAARQVACRVLGSQDYACENVILLIFEAVAYRTEHNHVFECPSCETSSFYQIARYVAQSGTILAGSKNFPPIVCWLPIRDCMCQTLEKGSLWGGVCLWLYMHPKDFLRKNNTGKLLWQVFGGTAARLVVCGIQEQEADMWEVFKHAGRDLVWCVFPEKTPPDYQVVDIPIANEAKRSEGGLDTIHFVLIDGTWSNSKSMVSRLKERATALWGESSMRCVALSPTSVSVMHDLRPQPSTERTCTAAAAGQLLQELSMRTELTELSRQGLHHSAELVEASLDSLQNALVSRRTRVGRTTSRAERVYYRSGRSPL